MNEQQLREWDSGDLKPRFPWAFFLVLIGGLLLWVALFVWLVRAWMWG